MARKAAGLAALAAGNREGRPAVRVALLASFNIDPIAPFLAEAFGRAGLWCESYLGPFGQIAQEILDPGSGLQRFAPDLVALIPAAEDFLAPLFQRPGVLARAEVDDLVGERIGQVGAWAGALRSAHPGAMAFIVPFGSGRLPGPHVLHPGSPERGQAAVAEYVDGIRRLAGADPGVIAVDWDRAAAEDGWASYGDDRLWYLARMRLNFPGLARLADLIVEHHQAVRGAARKVAVVDLDNTLWGGVVGEVGPSGVVLGDEGMGLAFQDFQRELLKWHDAGFLLAVCSKNDPPDAVAALDGHAGGVLRCEHFAAMKINWRDKAENIREIARELRLGLDSFIFLDDNPVERDWVARALPEVLVPELPADPADRPAFLRSFPPVRRVALTQADRARHRSYQATGGRERSRADAASYGEFLASLRQELDLAPLGPGSLDRAAQMCQRTNQFNLTTRRYGPVELERMAADPAVSIFTLSVRDRFEASGITGLAVLRRVGERAEIDAFLLSCRVLGRRVEDAFLAVLAETARAGGASLLVGRYEPTPKNGQVAGFYPDRGFRPLEGGAFALRLDGSDPLPARPREMTIQFA
jgi:FkbH-like protein